MFELINVRYKNLLHIDKLSIKENKTTCIIGKTGTGKTTFLKLLNKMISPDEGKILYQEKNIEEIDSVILRREVVMLYQKPFVLKGDIKKNLLMGLEFSNKPLVKDDILKHSLERVMLEKNLTDNAELLSGGEKQRVALARVLLMNPKVLLLDEPTSSLDEKTSDEVMFNVLEEAKQRNVTLIIVTHSADIAQKYANEIIRL